MDSKLSLMIFTLIATILLSFYLFKRYDLNRKQLFLFVLLILFWSSVNVIRSYRKSYALQPLDIGGLDLGLVMAANIAAGYGLISFFMRFPVFFLADWFHSKKRMFILATGLLVCTDIWVLYNPSYYSLLFSSLAMGLGASMLSVFNVAFAETFSKKQAMMSVSILSVAPLLAEFLMSPFQYFATSQEVNEYSMMWLVSLVLSIGTIVFLFFFQEEKTQKRQMDMAAFKRVIKHKELFVYGLVGILVSFVRFGLTGSNMVTYVQSSFIDMSPILVAYIDFIYSIAQLVAGVLAGLWFAKRIGTQKTLAMGLVLSLLFNVILLITDNSSILFLTYSISGFGYGLTYNSLIGLAMEPYDKRDRPMSMGLFQTMFAVGIYFGDRVYGLIQTLLPQGLSEQEGYRAIFLLILVFTLVTLVLVAGLLERERRKNRQLKI